MQFNKILFLTLIVEFVSSIMVFANLFIHSKYQWIWGISFSVDYAVFCYITYLMLEHNYIDYNKLLLIIMIKIKCNKFCCYCFRHLIILKNNDLDEDDSKYIDTTNMQTEREQTIQRVKSSTDITVFNGV